MSARILTLTIVSVLLSQVQCDTTVLIKLLNYTVSAHGLRQGTQEERCCVTGKILQPFICNQPCSPNLRFCVQTDPFATDVCSESEIITSALPATQTFIAGSNLGNISNPVTLAVTSWSVSAQISISVSAAQFNYTLLLANSVHQPLIWPVPNMEPLNWRTLVDNLNDHHVIAYQYKIFESGTTALNDTPQNCTAGFTGPNCNTDIDECTTTQPCQFDSTCINTPGSYNCHCPSGFTGTNCANDIDECGPGNPCVKPSFCINTMGSFQCYCQGGFTGPYCSVDIDECTSSPCNSKSVCVNTQGSFTCKCDTDYEGPNCDIDINPCRFHPCQNGGGCINSEDGAFYCECADGYLGHECQYDDDECLTHHPCQNNATCINVPGSFFCKCPDGYTGTKCDTVVDPCSNNPCRYGGTCEGQGDSYTCHCTPGFTGVNCTTDLNECDRRGICYEHSYCVNIIGSYVCQCYHGYEGPTCGSQTTDKTVTPIQATPAPQHPGDCADAPGYPCSATFRICNDDSIAKQYCRKTCDKYVHCLSWPRYISPWVLMDSNDVSTTDRTFNHDFGVVPMKVEVQVKSLTTGYIYPGLGSAHGDVEQGYRGGVLCIFDINQVRLFGATNDQSGDQKAFIIYTGNISYTSGNQEMSATGMVRVRVWHPDDFPPPDDSDTTRIKASNVHLPDHDSVSHNLGAMPAYTVVQYYNSYTSYGEPYYNWYAQAQSTNAHIEGDSSVKWGALTYAVGDNDVRIWGSTSGSHGLFSHCEGWGTYVTTGCSLIRATVKVYVWSSLPGVTHLQMTGPLSSITDTMSKEFTSATGFNSDSDLMSVVFEATDGDNAGYQFSSYGAAQIDGIDKCGGVVHGYLDTARTFRVWYPTKVLHDGYIVVVSEMGSDWNNQKTSEANLSINIWKVNASVTTTSAPTTTSTASTTTTTAPVTTTTTVPPTTTSTTSTLSTTPPVTTTTTATPTTTTTSSTALTTTTTATTTTIPPPTLISTAPSTSATPAPPSTTTTAPGMVCFNTTVVINITQIQEQVDEIVANLTVPTKSTGKFLRSLTSATDDRSSSTYIGLIGTLFFALTIAAIVIPDVMALIRGIYCKWIEYRTVYRR